MESKNAVNVMKLMAAGFILAPSMVMADAPALDALKATAGSEATAQATAAAQVPTGVIISAGSYQNQSAVTKLTPEQLQAFRALATWIYQQHGVNGSILDGFTRTQSLSINGDVRSDGTLNLKTICFMHWVDANDPTLQLDSFVVRAEDGVLSSGRCDAPFIAEVRQDPQDQKLIQDKIAHWVDYARKKNLVSSSDSE